MGTIKLLWLKLVVMQRNAVEYAKVVWKYYGDSNFRRWDRALLSYYLFRNPYRICKRYLQRIGLPDPYLYGETPLTSLELIAKECGLQKSDTVFELGCGRGRGCLWLRAFIGCKVVGIELVPFFIEKAQLVQKCFQIDGLEFRQGDIVEANYKGATVLYLYGTCFEDEFIEALVRKFKSLPSGTKIITVSYALSEYTHLDWFETLKVFPVQYTWGEADVYLQVRR